MFDTAKFAAPLSWAIATVSGAVDHRSGFVIVDDFKTAEWRGGRGWEQFADNMRRVLPEARFADLDTSHPIFHQFFSASVM
ncbi:MAG: DUF4159 domain-containing protein [Vicinamibacterales bacterium]